MRQMIGADVEDVLRLAAHFDSSASRLEELAAQVGHGVRISAWAGDVAVRFRLDWDSGHSFAVRKAAEALHRQADSLRRHAGDQTDASSAAGGFTTGVADSARTIHHMPSEYLGLARSSYTNELPAGWSAIGDAQLRELGVDPAQLHSVNGLDAQVATDGHGKYVVTFRGSTGDSGAIDWWRENGRSALSALGAFGQAASDVAGIVDPGTSTEEAMGLARNVAGALGAENVQFVGHSLGGRHAAMASLVTGSEAVTFNAAGPTADDYLYARSLLGDDASFGEYVIGRWASGSTLAAGFDHSSITSYVSSGDPLSASQDLTSASDSIGTRITVRGGDHNLESFDGKLGPSGDAGW